MEKTILYFVPIERVAAYLHTNNDVIRKELSELVLESVNFNRELVLLNEELKKYERKYSIENNSIPAIIHRTTIKLSGKLHQCIVMMEFSDKQAEQNKIHDNKKAKE